MTVLRQTPQRHGRARERQSVFAKTSGPVRARADSIKRMDNAETALPTYFKIVLILAVVSFFNIMLFLILLSFPVYI